MPVFKPVAQSVALIVAASLTATPAVAVDLPHLPAPVPQDHAPQEVSTDESSDYHRRYRYRRHRVDAGDVLAGVLIIGGIAAIANAAKNNRDRDYRDRDYRNRDREYRDRDTRYRDRRDDRRYDNARGIDRAVSMCLREIERDVRVDQVDEVERDGEGWKVKGRLYNGESFSCEIGADGRIDEIDYDGAREFASAEPVEDNQWGDDRYAQARQRIERQASADSDVRPAYPGGPLPGEEIDADVAAAPADDDDRYNTHEAPDFSEA
ncbi:hypothetical protein [Altererythrobacter sp. MF3-039]|uniref:hypothetical protein n=1 Tax=Altererythrobacter sp. MF3-039 TaxID=3252901 RepID=UPI00390CDA1B